MTSVKRSEAYQASGRMGRTNNPTVDKKIHKLRVYYCVQFCLRSQSESIELTVDFWRFVDHCQDRPVAVAEQVFHDVEP